MNQQHLRQQQQQYQQHLQQQQQQYQQQRQAAAKQALSAEEIAKQKAAEAEKQAAKDLEEDLSTEIEQSVFSEYSCRSLDIGKEHPGNIAESGLLATIDLPRATFPTDGLETPIQKQALSALQLEGVLYACQRHQTLLPDGRRAGFFIGDGAGVGKGRQVSGIIADNCARNRWKHIWFSISSDLIQDAERDLKGIGCQVKVHNGCKSLDAASKGLGMGREAQRGVIFSTYSTLVSSVSRKGKGKESRLQQLINWCGADAFKGCLVFDECHKAKNFQIGKPNSSTKIAQAVIKIQNLLPQARVVYCSATGVTDIRNMAYASRLGLWGPSLAFETFENFISNMEKRGIGALEMLAMEMKSAGMYVSRGLSYHGAEFLTDDIALEGADLHAYDQAAAFFLDVKVSY